MKLIGMLDSPYVRRVAISLKSLDIPFEHASVSVFRHFAQFQQINPVVKAPTLVLDNGEVLMDSTLIIDYLEALSGPDKSLMPAQLDQRVRALRLIGLALAACEKSVQIYYERTLRPAEKQHEPWLERVGGQLLAAYSALEQELVKQPLKTDGSLDQAGITLAVAWSFTNLVVPDQVSDAQFPKIRAFTAYAEQLPAFVSTPIT
ncbi:glutathione S-transferase [Pseudomonas sp. FW306-02-F02-AA]|jgi:glutathione S-transferase|uniref:Glutathione S-transferase n=1 Tax=Pseudomonas fluorescens TaxID=294 RepID=A0A0N9VY12_PSEFL|nr:MULTISPECIES: glutathione S-transferase N-terminal domain-containing protein [Pseudomonas]ALI03479.1 glutathione S-transferase [Pseudomonas fluorescens]PMZ03491.1 glutathione S-transferase [Pseudomonas sp. FW306-02-F02-AB]PMZ09646.1 glutathione S-transferase [Pseudomonas sp. FW306-02-H06C]PMZ15386.1 glutathione S-transferase [Pseudomonas sp. FW306-02-F02-AA]PMZ21155.1 glutathione S-transferase [Pseudomonas sp. FW306-02-F08-AA]